MPISDSGHADRYFRMMAMSQGDRFAIG
jgi:hypothetical protein